MAKFLSQVYTSIRGKVGGIVYTKNQYASLIARAFASPTNPSTDAQTRVRTAFSEASQAWQDLTQANRDLWEAYAATLEYEGPHGTYKLPGRSVFMSNLSFALGLEAVGGSAIVPGDDPPLVAGFENLGVVQEGTYTTISSTGVAISVGNPNAYALAILIQRSVGWNATKNVFHGPWPDVNTLGDDLPASATTTFELETGTGTAGSVFFIRVRAITAAVPHRVTSDHIIRAIAVANGP